MYQFSRAIYRELVPLLDARATPGGRAAVLRSCEAAIDRLANDRHYFARPARTLFLDIRANFPVVAQRHVFAVVSHYLARADEYLASLPPNGLDVNGQPLQCRAVTRKGTPCQRMPLVHNGYCPSHQHLADSEDREVLAA